MARRRGEDTLEQALARLFEGGRTTRASWFALTGGERLFAAGEPAETLYLVRSGRLGVFRQAEGQEPEFLGVIRPGEPAGEMSLLAGTPHSATVVALRDSEILALPRDAFFEVARSQPDLMVEMARLMIRRARDTTARAAAPSVYGFVSTRARPIRPFVDQVAGALDRLGFTARIVDSSALGSAAEWFSTVEESHDLVLYVAEGDEPAWAALCGRQADRLFLVGDGGSTPPAQVIGRDRSAEQHQLTDLVLLRDPAAGPPRGTAAWLDTVDPARWFHVREGIVAEAERIARVISGTSVGLVLSGGGARAYAHIGAIRALRDAGAPLDFLGGASMGAVIGAGLALGWPQAELEDRIHRAFVHSSPLTDIRMPLIAMTGGRRVDSLLEEHYGDVDIADLSLPFFCMSSNLTSGAYLVHRRGLLRQALRASVSLPGVLPPVVMDGQVLVDGAVMKSFPADIMRAWHLGPVVGVDVSRARGVDPQVLEDPPSWWKWLLTGEWKKGPPIVSILMRSGTVTTAADLADSRQATDLLVMPELQGVEIRDWKAYEPAVQAGWTAATAALGQLSGPITHLRLRKAEAEQAGDVELESADAGAPDGSSEGVTAP